MQLNHLSKSDLITLFDELKEQQRANLLLIKTLTHQTIELADEYKKVSEKYQKLKDFVHPIILENDNLKVDIENLKKQIK